MTEEWIRKVIVPKGGGSTLITIPKKLCDQLGLKAGDHMRVSSFNDGIYIEKVE